MKTYENTLPEKEYNRHMAIKRMMPLYNEREKKRIVQEGMVSRIAIDRPLSDECYENNKIINDLTSQIEALEAPHNADWFSL